MTNETSKLRRALRSLLRALPGSFVAGLITFICYGLHLSFLTASFFYLIVVFLQSLIGDFLSSAVVSIVSFLFLDYFFVPPLFSFRVSDSSDTAALLAFVTASLVITRLTTKAHEAADSEERQRREMTHLYELARELLTLKPSAVLDVSLLKPFRSHFGLRAVCIFEAEAAKLHMDGDSLHQLAEATRDAYISEREFDDHSAQVAMRLLRVGGRIRGAIGFEGLRELELTAGPLAALATILMERCQAFEQASRAAAETEAEVFRGALLDALAHEFKTPLATIVMAAGGIQQAGPLRREQLELAATVEDEASRLAQLTTRLLRVARLDRNEVRPQMEITDIRKLVASLVDQYAKRWPQRRFSLVPSVRVDALAERDLLGLGLGQLLDNACKYSQPGSEITIGIEETGETLAIRVWNNGSTIPKAEQARIFDRFFRGTEARMVAPGSGLGLYIARKIAIAHGGSLELEEDSGGGVAFRFVIPYPDTEQNHDGQNQGIGSR